MSISNEMLLAPIDKIDELRATRAAVVDADLGGLIVADNVLEIGEAGTRPHPRASRTKTTVRASLLGRPINYTAQAN
ncbi:hypothetical protein ACQR1I_02985 [Bradyrhizobium sp. HKCCYLS2038]|uniref:hypothetical protein n=1 Tax=unclassified Bradyrhizobium TaxID=2631580 RepID=UPI003EBD52E2